MSVAIVYRLFGVMNHPKVVTFVMNVKKKKKKKGKIMGRYYHGDIEGKFWFGVQSSTDAEFFGVEGNANFLHYYFDEDNKKDIVKGKLECERKLGKYKKLLDDFFDTRESYNNQKLAEFLNEKEKPHNHSEDEVRYYLEWYARLHLGKKIYDCILEQGSCSFEAEL